MTVFYPVQIKFISHKTGLLIYETPTDKLLTAKFNKQLNEVGVFSLTIPYDNFLDTNIEYDDFIEFYIPSNSDSNSFVKFDTYLMREKQIYIDDNQIKYLAFAGFSLNQLIERRILDFELDSLASNGYVTMSDTAHNILSHLADEHFINCSDSRRNYPFLTINEIELNTNIVNIRKTREELFPIFSEVATAGNTNFRITRVSGRQLELRLGKEGTDKTKTANYPFNPSVTISPDYGNVQNVTFTESRKDESNVLYLLGEGEGVNQTYIRVNTAETTASFYNYIEFLKTFREKNSSYNSFNTLYSKAINLLYENQKSILIKFQIDNFTNTPNIELGDRITFRWNQTAQDLEVSEITIDISESGEFKKELKLNPNVNL